MGRKGDNKRKTGKAKSKPIAGGAVAAIAKAADNLPVKVMDSVKADAATTSWKKKPKK